MRDVRDLDELRGRRKLITLYVETRGDEDVQSFPYIFILYTYKERNKEYLNYSNI